MFTRQGAVDGMKVAKIFSETFLRDYDLIPQLHDLRIPVTIVHGENDIVPLATAKATQAAIPGAKIVILKECDHFPYIEKPNEFFAVFQLNNAITRNSK